VPAHSTQYNTFAGLVQLGPHHFLRVCSSGRNHSGHITIQLSDPRTLRPCSLEQWLSSAGSSGGVLAPAAGGTLAGAQGGQAPVEILKIGHSPALAEAKMSGSSAEHGISLSLSMHGRKADCVASLFVNSSLSSINRCGGHIIKLMSASSGSGSGTKRRMEQMEGVVAAPATLAANSLVASVLARPTLKRRRAP